MRVRILGTAAGGGFPQWNCACSNCRRLREGNFAGRARSQAQLAWDSGSGEWTLLNASPDLRYQIEAAPELWPTEDATGKRHSPIQDVILTGAEVDQALGLLLLREFHCFRVHATRSIRRILTEDNSLFGVLARFPGQVSWNDIGLGKPFCVGNVRMEALSLANSFPGFVARERAAELEADEAAIGLLVTASSGGTLAFLPGIGWVSDELLERLEACDAILFDGTFWSDGEPTGVPGITRTARQMGHLPISGPGGSLERLAALAGPRKIYIHINNTNPILDEASGAYRAVCDAGWEVGQDGMEIDL